MPANAIRRCRQPGFAARFAPRSRPTEAVTRHFDDGHAQLACSFLHRLERIEAALGELDAVIAADCRP